MAYFVPKYWAVWLTSVAQKGGKETLVRRFPPHKLVKAYEIFSRWGFGAIALPALLPPPLPMVPFLLAASTMQYPLRKFLLALTLGFSLCRCEILIWIHAEKGWTHFMIGANSLGMRERFRH
jgi:membrane protein DedA with SNARE-associated domain